MKRISVIATVDRQQLCEARDGWALSPHRETAFGQHQAPQDNLSPIDAALHSISRTVKRFLPDVVISGVAGLIKTSLGAATTGCWFRQQRWFEMSANCAQRLPAKFPLVLERNESAGGGARRLSAFH